MTGEALAQDPYEAVLADLRAKRDQIDQTIALLTGLRAGTTVVSPASMTDVSEADPAGIFLGMSISDAAKKLLALRKRTMGNADIAKELQAGGLALTSAEPANVIGSVLSRRFMQVGDIVKVSRGTWGLKEWYPGRNFKHPSKLSVNDVSPAGAPASVYELKVNDLGGVQSDDDDDL